MATGFSVEPTQLLDTANRFTDLAESLGVDAALSAPTYRSEGGLFGLLPEGQAALERYRQRAEEAIEGLRALAQALDEDLATGLRATAAGYLRTEEATILI